MSKFDWIRWIPFLPLLAAAIHGVMIGLVRRSMPRAAVIAVSCGSVLLSFGLSCWAFARLVRLPADERVLVDSLYTWIGAGIGDTRLAADLSFRVDPFSSVRSVARFAQAPSAGSHPAINR